MEQRRKILVPVQFEGNALPTSEELAAIFVGSVNVDTEEFDIVAANESDIEDSEKEEWILSDDN